MKWMILNMLLRASCGPFVQDLELDDHSPPEPRDRAGGALLDLVVQHERTLCERQACVTSFRTLSIVHGCHGALHVDWVRPGVECVQLVAAKTH